MPAVTDIVPGKPQVTVFMCAGSLHAYKKALDIYRADHPAKNAAKPGMANGHGPCAVPVNPKLLNNAAVMHMRGGNFRLALELMEEAIQV